MYRLRDDQQCAVERIVGELTQGRSTLVVSPTGSGKSFILAEAKRRLPGSILTVPSIEVGFSVGKKIDPTVRCREKDLEALGIWTIKRFHNYVLDARVDPPPYLLHDEAHHSVDNTHDVVHAACGHCPRAGLTATAYRGTREETGKLIQAWGKPWVSLTIRDAVQQGIIAKPVFKVWPLVNDDAIKVDKGEFVVSQVDKAVADCLPDLLKRVKAELWDPFLGTWKRPTMFRLTSTSGARTVTDALNAAGLAAVCVTGEAANEDRQAAFSDVVDRRKALVNVRVVSEGVDLPIRVLVDLAPCMSPVLWMQTVGRETRPVPAGEPPPLYIGTNHNLTRHAYLWEGVIPAGEIRDAQTVWGKDFKPSRRSLARALNLEGFGKFTVSPVPLLDGSTASLYALQTKDGMHLYAVLIHPALAEPWYFQKTNVTAPDAPKKRFKPPGCSHEVEYVEKIYGPWVRIPEIPSADGYVSVKPGHLSQPMIDWWKRSAAGRGLDPSVATTIDARQFQALPILMNARLRYRPAAPTEALTTGSDVENEA